MNRILLAGMVALGVGVPSLWADKVNYDGLDYPDVTVNGYRNGGLSVTVKAGGRVFDLAKVKWIDLDAAPKMRQAEELRTKDPRGALALYRDAIRGLNDPDLKQLAE